MLHEGKVSPIAGGPVAGRPLNFHPGPGGVKAQTRGP